MTQDFSKRIDAYFFVPTHLQQESKRLRKRLADRLIGTSDLRNLAQEDFELVYSDHAYYAAQLKFLELLKLKRVPHILHLRGDWWTEFQDTYHNIGTNLWKRMYLRQSEFYQSLGVSSTKEIMPICSWLEQIVKKHLPTKRTAVVYQGVDPILFAPCKPRMQLEHPAVAILQNHTIRQKVDALLAFRSVVQELPRVHFYVADGQYGGYFSEVKAAFSVLSNVKFLHAEYPHGVKDLLSSCDMLLLRSGLDCCPTTILEAGLMEKPVIASKVGGIPELVRDKETGFLLENVALDDWKNRINQIGRDEALAKGMGKRAREYVEERFSWGVVAGQVEQIIERNV